MEVPCRTKNRTNIWSRNLALVLISREEHNSKTYMHPNVSCGTIYNSQIMEASLMFTDRWIGKEDMVFINNGMLPSN